MKRFAAFVLGMVLLFSASPVSGVDKGCFTILSEDDLVCRADDGPGTFDAGDGVRFRMGPGLSERKLVGPPVTWMTITVLDGDTPVLDLPDSFYIGYALLAQGDARYWMIGEYTGGMHCCARYHFFSKPSPAQALRYLGATAGSAEGIDEEPFLCRGGALYLEDRDTRFLYFHTPYAQSRLILPTHYRLTPSSMSVDNRPFLHGVAFFGGVRSLDVDSTSLIGKGEGEGEDRALIRDTSQGDRTTEAIHDRSDQGKAQASLVLVRRPADVVIAFEDRLVFRFFDTDARICNGDE